MNLTDEQIQRITEEKALIVQGLARPEVQLIFRKLDEAANEMQAHYDRLDFLKDQGKAIYIQCFRDIVKKEIPRIFENIINIDAPAGKPRWSFRQWLSVTLRRMADSLSV